MALFQVSGFVVANGGNEVLSYIASQSQIEGPRQPKNNIDPLVQLLLTAVLSLKQNLLHILNYK